MPAIEQAAGDSQATTSTQQASGASVFWALTCIVLNAMSQSSFCGSFWQGDDTESPLWLYRSSPTICLLDAAAEIWIMIDKYRRSTPRSYQNRAAKPTDISIRLAVFMFAVMPQAIKLFSIKGIWITQVFAGLFLVSSLTSIVRTLCLAEPQEDLTRLVKHLQADKVSSLHTTMAIVMLGWLPHVALMYGTCVFLSSRLPIPIDEYIVNVMGWAAAGFYAISTLYGFLKTIFPSAGLLSPMIPLPVFNTFVSISNFGVVLLTYKGDVRNKVYTFPFACVFLIYIILCSYLVTALLDTFAKALTRWLLRIPTPSESDAQRSSRAEELELTPVGEALSDDAPGGHSESSTYALPGASQGTPEAGDSLPPPHSRRTEGLRDSPPTSTQPPTISDPWLLISANTESADITDAITPTSRDISTSVHRSNNTDARPDRAPGSINTAGSRGYLPPQPKADDIINLYFWMVLSPGPIYILMFLTLNILYLYFFSSFYKDEKEVLYVYAFPSFHDDEGKDPTAQEAAERDDAENQTTSQKTITWKQRFSLTPDGVVTFILSLAINLGSMVHIVLRSCNWYTYDWLGAKIKSKSETYLMLVLTIANFALAIIYYLIYYDGAGTFAPSWTQIFGKV